jgi:D-glycero-alpha-D-manno-heptose-7-phosphate kinase
MIISRAPFRISLFGGSTDYEDYYSKYGSLLVGTTIDKYFYSSFRYRPQLLADQSVISYSQIENVNDLEDIKHPLIRAIMDYYGIKRAIDLHLFADIPSRTGLGGSSAFCVSLLAIMNKIWNSQDIDKHVLAEDAIEIERNILKESGGIQDQIWASYGGFNSVHIDTHGDFKVKPIPISEEFKKEFNRSIVLVYTKEDNRTDLVAKSHENKYKHMLQYLAKEGYEALVKEDIKSAGQILLESWQEKQKISDLISTSKIDEIAEKMLKNGCYGVKLLGSGGSGFLLGIGHSDAIRKCRLDFTDRILDFKFENEGVSFVFQSKNHIY